MKRDLEVVEYTSGNTSKGLINSLRLMGKDIKKSRELSYRLAKRDISAMYRQSLLGYLWVFLIPLVNTATWLFLKGSGIVVMQDTGVPYVIYVFSGTVMWQVFVESLQSPIQQVASSKALLAKLNFPREAIILAGVYKNLFNTLIKLIILLPIIFVFGGEPSWHIVLFPFVLLSIVLVGTTIGLLFAPIGSLYTDIGRVIPYAGQFLMFFAPVVFVLPSGGAYLSLFEANFMTPLIITGRDMLTNGAFEWLGYFFAVVAISSLMLIVALGIFRKTMPILIERMSA